MLVEDRKANFSTAAGKPLANPEALPEGPVNAA